MSLGDKLLSGKLINLDWDSLSRWSRAAAIILAVVLIYILDVWVLGTLAALMKCNIGPGLKPDFSTAQWYFHHPFLASWAYFLKIVGLRELSRPEVFRAWLGLNCIAVPLLLLLGLVAAFYYLQRNGWQLGSKEPKFTGDPTHGTAGWLQPRKAKKMFKFEPGPGILFGKLPTEEPVILPPDTKGNKNVVVIAPPGRGKSRAYVRNNLFQAVLSGWSVIATDPKGELTEDFRVFFEENDYTVKIFNLVEMVCSDRWNPLSEVRSGIDAQMMAQVIIDNTDNPARKGKDEFWSRAEMNLLKALILLVAIESPPSERNFGTLYSILSCGSLERMDSLFQTLPPNHPAKIPYNIYKETSSTVRSGVVIGLGTRLQVFQETLVQKLTEETDIDLELPGRERCAYFCIIPDTDSTYYFLSSLFFSFLFIRLTRLADRSPGRHLPVFVNFLLDEFCNVGRVPDFDIRISTMRSRGIGCSIVLQSINQLEGRYEAWETIMDDCDSWLILGSRSNTTAEYISRHLGEGTVQTTALRRRAGLEGVTDLGTLTYSPERRRLLTPDEVITLDDEDIILSYRNLRPFRIKKMDFTEHEMAKLLKPVPVLCYNPAWSVGLAGMDDLSRFSSAGRGEVISGEGKQKSGGEGIREIKEVIREVDAGEVFSRGNDSQETEKKDEDDSFWH